MCRILPRCEIRIEAGDDRLPSNGLGFSGGAPIDREDSRADSTLQNSNDLAGAKRRPLQAHVGRQPFRGIRIGYMPLSPSIVRVEVADGLRSRNSVHISA